MSHRAKLAQSLRLRAAFLLGRFSRTVRNTPIVVAGGASWDGYDIYDLLFPLK